ncbi:acylphosphatase [Sphingomonas sp. RB56-2]|uniref:Acylphosphatase n=1 Tax=Sphingomonas brevis TaxID=2908206 RepID=A0ABT0SAK3_9SPHN|nr:acylphosphatase [Sphingomonas brevis]MCL6741111.1 acylphosphatase [Sphingomonas brevis]
MTRIARHVRVSGRVQGVFFRAWTAEQARLLGVNGWVRNSPDGSVEAHLQGDRWAVRRLIELLHRGPPSANVDEVIDDDAELGPDLEFEVRH